MEDFSSKSGSDSVAVAEDIYVSLPSISEPCPVRATFDRRLWKRMEFDRIPIYVRSDSPDWFVPNDAGDEILRLMLEEDGPSPTVPTLRFLERLPAGIQQNYPGRGARLKIGELKELWFHITNRCNQHCSHCLFECSVPGDELLSKDRIFDLANQAHHLGCRFFAITGGEPLVHPDFVEIVDRLLAEADHHVAVLTNGMLIGSIIEAVDRWPRDRFHLQISLDGGRDMHDRVRGQGAFDRLMENFLLLKSQGVSFGVSMCVETDNMDELPQVVEIAAQAGAGNVHCLWFFAGSLGNVFELADPQDLFDRLVPAYRRARELGITIDNVEQIHRQVFGPCGMICDGTNSGWQALTVGPDGELYPSPALVGVKKLKTHLDDDLASAWRQSEVLEKLRQSTVAGLDAPMLMMLGGGDPDHSYMRSGEFVGFDPYWSLYEKIALWLIAEKAKERPANGSPALRLKMGEVIAHGEFHHGISLRSNKRLFTVVRNDETVFVHELYSDASREQPEVAFHSVLLPESWVSHIPPEYRVRSYSFASPALAIEIAPGRRVLEIGSDAGLDCLIVSKFLGPEGSVVGLESQDVLLDHARLGARIVAENLGYANVDFIKHNFAESLPAENESVDIVIVNCSIDKTDDKRRFFEEIFRVLRSEGRLIIFDTACDEQNDFSVCTENDLCSRYVLRSLTSRDLLGLLEESGFVCPSITQWGADRLSSAFSFYRFGLDIRKSTGDGSRVSVMYRGPFASVVTSRGTLLTPGNFKAVLRDEVDSIGEDHLIFEAEQ
jgi:MoaA/NifB/PqqE/SkfB family radical SAM enzyme/SAM-dependent methyltransferase